MSENKQENINKVIGKHQENNKTNSKKKTKQTTNQNNKKKSSKPKKTRQQKIKERKEKYETIDKFRDEMNRRLESLQIIYQLKQNNLDSKYPAIRDLLNRLNNYVVHGSKQDFIIDFPEKNKIIKGYLPIYKNEECVVVIKERSDI